MEAKEYSQCNHVGIRCSDTVAKHNSSSIHLPVITGKMEGDQWNTVFQSKGKQIWAESCLCERKTDLSRILSVLYGGLKAMDRSNKSALEVLFYHTWHNATRENEAAAHSGLSDLLRLTLLLHPSWHWSSEKDSSRHLPLTLIPLLTADSGILDLEVQIQGGNFNFTGVHHFSPCTSVIMPAWHVDVTNDVLKSAEVFQENNLMIIWGFMIREQEKPGKAHS